MLLQERKSFFSVIACFSVFAIENAEMREYAKVDYQAIQF